MRRPVRRYVGLDVLGGIGVEFLDRAPAKAFDSTRCSSCPPRISTLSKVVKPSVRLVLFQRLSSDRRGWSLVPILL